MKLPTKEDINVYNSLDEISAQKNFLNKTIEEAELLFRENSIKYQEDLMWMRIKAFDFYMQSLINYLQSDYSKGDSDIINCMYDNIEFQMNNNNFSIATNSVKTMIDYVIIDYNKFDVEEEKVMNLKIYGNLLEKYKQLNTDLIN